MPTVPPAGPLTLEGACDEILAIEQQIREAYPLTHPQHEFWVKLAGLLNMEQSRARGQGRSVSRGPGVNWSQFNRVLEIARAWVELRDKDKI